MKSATVTLPAGKTCTGGTGNCVLQWSWFATNDGGSYFGMADINIQATAAMPTKTPDLVITNFAGTTCASPSVLTSAVATVSDTCTSRGRKRAR